MINTGTGYRAQEGVRGYAKFRFCIRGDACLWQLDGRNIAPITPMLATTIELDLNLYVGIQTLRNCHRKPSIQQSPFSCG